MISPRSDDPANAPGLIGYGAGLAGALAGSMGGAILGGPGGAVAGAFLGETLDYALTAAASRLFSQRERERVGAVAILARSTLQGYMARGARLRGDSFLRARIDGRAPADEVIEHVLRVAQGAYEERKLPHVAAVLATVAISEWLDENAAHWIVSTIEQLSWPKLVALALVSENEQHPLPDRKVGGDLEGWSPWAVHHVFTELQHTDQSIRRAPRTKETGAPDFDSYFADLRLTSGGKLVAFCADLDTISKPERDAMLAAIEI